jgi:hypothetical protein
VDVEEFYDENPARRGSAEFEYGTDWSDANGARLELSWVESTGELYTMMEPAEPIISDMFGDQHLQAMPSTLLVVEILGVVATRAELDVVLHGWANAMGKPNSLSWVRDRLAHGPDTTLGRDGTDSPDIAFEVGGGDGRSSVIVSSAIKALHEVLPVTETAKLVAYHEQALTAGADPNAEWHRAYACARWADQIVAIPAHHHLGADAARALEIVREVGVTIGAEIRDIEYLPFGRSVSPQFQTELAWVYEAVHVAEKAAEKSGWNAVPWEQLLQTMLAVGHSDR